MYYKKSYEYNTYDDEEGINFRSPFALIEQVFVIRYMNKYKQEICYNCQFKSIILYNTTCIRYTGIAYHYTEIILMLVRQDYIKYFICSSTIFRVTKGWCNMFGKSTYSNPVKENYISLCIFTRSIVFVFHL
jgi:hypothetical protein